MIVIAAEPSNATPLILRGVKSVDAVVAVVAVVALPVSGPTNDVAVILPAESTFANVEEVEFHCCKSAVWDGADLTINPTTDGPFE